MEILRRDLGTYHFRPESVFIPWTLTPAPHAAPHATHPTEEAPSPLAVPANTRPPGRQQQAVEQNLWPAPQLQVATGFRIFRTIDSAAEHGVEIPGTDDGHHFFLSYHLKGVDVEILRYSRSSGVQPRRPRKEMG